MKKATQKRRRASLAELRAMQARGEIRKTPDDAPAYDMPDGFWEHARPYVSEKTPVNLRVDADVLDYFRSQGKGHLTRMNAVLRSYVEAQKRAAPQKRKSAGSGGRKAGRRSA